MKSEKAWLANKKYKWNAIFLYISERNAAILEGQTEKAHT